VKTPTLPDPYDVILAGASMLVASNPAHDSPEGRLLDAIGYALEAYEAEVYPLGAPRFANACPECGGNLDDPEAGHKLGCGQRPGIRKLGARGNGQT